MRVQVLPESVFGNPSRIHRSASSRPRNPRREPLASARPVGMFLCLHLRKSRQLQIFWQTLRREQLPNISVDFVYNNRRCLYFMDFLVFPIDLSLFLV